MTNKETKILNIFITLIFFFFSYIFLLHFILSHSNFFLFYFISYYLKFNYIIHLIV